MAILDEIDRKLLDLLQVDDRVPVVELGKAIGVAPSTLNDRIRRLVKQGGSATTSPVPGTIS
jgi:Lrp/AsnC family transcriptional regulator, leucine-responsive regulatory protein